ncbi:hypothetical protein CS022_12925 [Veronia nyctiphanis]|uniref:LysM domain-containing protein n=1 Tax=Veronia nyctiphanis TaxID=1278244 RepID=A0A4Q0YVG9_9GAMM|nr:FimV/HubP family polar landmark protein [Veronia nyctiphanis]RXJ72971.1 hypothetical protein CS022_12925 [Veronia nyctiphanis]
MKRTFSFKKYGLKSKKVRFSSILTLFLFAAFSATADIKIIGPDNESLSQEARVAPVNRTASPERPLFSVPEDGNTTLWSIATQYRPDNSVSIYQTLGAIFRLNPAAFENQNIHSLIPGTILRMPTNSEIRREQTEDVVQRLNEDKARKALAQRQQATRAQSPLSGNTATAQPATAQVNRPQAEPATVSKPEAPAATPQISTTTPAKPVAPATSNVASEQQTTEASQTEQPAKEPVTASEDAAPKPTDEPLKPSTTTPPKPDLSSLKNQVDNNDVEVGRLLESNHILKVRLAEVQGELKSLREKITLDDQLTTELQSLLADHKAKLLAAEVEAQEDVWESLVNNPAVLIALGVTPALLVISLIGFILFRRSRKEEQPVAEPDGFDDLDIPA